MATSSYAKCFEAVETPRVVVPNMLGDPLRTNGRSNVHTHKNLHTVLGVQVQRAFHGPLRTL